MGCAGSPWKRLQAARHAVVGLLAAGFFVTTSQLMAGFPCPPLEAAEITESAKSDPVDTILGPEGIAVGREFVYAMGQEGNLYRVPKSGGRPVKLGSVGELGSRKLVFPTGMVLASPDVLFVAVAGLANGCIVRVPLAADGRSIQAGRIEIVADHLGTPNGLAFDAERARLYVSDEGGLLGSLGSKPIYRLSFERKDYRRGKVTSKCVVARCPMPNGIAISKDGRFLFVAQTMSFGFQKGGVLKFDLNGTCSKPLRNAIGGWPDGLALSPDGKFLLLLANKDARVYCISTADLSIRSCRQLPPGSGPASLAIAQQDVYFSSFWDPLIWKILALPLPGGRGIFHRQLYRFPLGEIAPTR